ncbi:MAG: LysR family transcriptional regulator [Pseudomonadota bacterium]
MALRFTFRQLEYLVAVGECGTIALASEKVNVSSPSISAAIGQLEAEFGTQIFVRHHAQGLSLTPGGRQIFNEAKKILDDAAALNDLAGDITNKPRGPISIGVLATIAPLISAALRRSFEQKYPDATVTLFEAHQADLFNMLGRAEIDVAITYEMEIPKDVVFENLITLPAYVMLSTKHPLAKQKKISLNTLQDEPMILLDLPISREYFLSIFQTCQIRPNIIQRSSDLSVVRSLVANQLGYSLVNMQTKSKLAPDGEELTFLRLDGDIRPLVLGLVTKQVEYRSRIVDAFYEHVQAQVAEHGLPGVVLAK